MQPERAGPDAPLVLGPSDRLEEVKPVGCRGLMGFAVQEIVIGRLLRSMSVFCSLPHMDG